jgi:hypothetical protein
MQLRTIHIEIDYHFMRDQVSSRALFVPFISSKDLLVDTFTKSLPMTKFSSIRDNLNLRELPLRLRGHIETAVEDIVSRSSDKDKHQSNSKKMIDKDTLSFSLFFFFSFLFFFFLFFFFSFL